MIRKDFLALLREHDIDRHSRWTDVKKRIDSDSRYRAVDSSLLREDYFLDYCKILKDEKKKGKDKDRDRKDKKDKKSDKDRGKDEKRRDSKDSSSKAEKPDKDNDDQEDGEHPATSEDEAERQQKDRDRQMRAEQSIKEREKEVQIQLAGHLRERDKEREHHKRDEAMRHFSALLADLVRNADLAWKEVKKLLRKDHRWELVEQLDRDVRERLFNEHIDQLSKKKRDKFREMLDEIPKLSLVAAFKDIKKSIRDDPRYLKYSSSEKCEREFRDYLKDKAVEAKASFRELLLECKLITHKSFDTVTENPAHLKEIEEILKNDNRYLVLEPLQPERSQMLLTYLEDLHKRGPPPPPTASESTRRNK